MFDYYLKLARNTGTQKTARYNKEKCIERGNFLDLRIRVKNFPENLASSSKRYHGRYRTNYFVF